MPVWRFHIFYTRQTYHQVSANGGSSDPPTGDELLTESGDPILTESGDAITID